MISILSVNADADAEAQCEHSFKACLDAPLTPPFMRVAPLIFLTLLANSTNGLH